MTKQMFEVTSLRRSLLIASLFFTAIASGQVTVNGSLGGVVLDPRGAVVADALLKVSRQGQGIEVQTRSGGEGSFQFVGLAPGRYAVSVEKAGFQKLVREGITVEVNQTARLTLTLSVGEVSSTVTVLEDAPVVQSQSSDISLLIDGGRIRDLPLNGKDFQKLMYLAPGSGNFRANNNNSNGPTSGSRESANNYVIDGITANDERETAGLALGASFRQLPNVISTEALSEYRVITSNADASFGRGSGAQVNVVTKSGTNQLHGSAYEYFRNSALDARDFFNRGPFFTEDGRAKTPPFRQNLFGATIGGPIVKDKHFFFGSYEGFRQRLEQTSAPILPSADLVGLMPGQLGRLARAYYFDQNLIPQQGYVPGTVRAFSAADRAAAVAAGFPAQLFDGSFDNREAATIVTSRSSTRDFTQNAFLIRTDHLLRPGLNLSFRYAQALSDSISNTSGLPGSGVLLPSKFYSPTMQLTWSASPSQLLEFRAGVMRRVQDYQIDGGLPSSITALGVDPNIGVGLSLTGTTTFQLPSIAPFLLLDNQTVPQYALTHTWTKSRWTLKAGMDIRWIQSNFINKGFPRPSYSFVGLTGTNGLLGSSPAATDAVAQVASQTLFGTNGGPTTAQRGWRSTQQEYFTQLDLRLRRDLTLNLGLRYSYFGVYHEVNNALSNLYPVGTSGVETDQSTFRYGRTANRVEALGPNRPFYQPDRNNFQPRVGLAWNVSGQDRSVLRAAFGLYSDRLYQLVISEAARNTPFAISGQANNVPFRPSQPVPINPNIPVFYAIDPTLKNPLIYRWNLAWEQRFGKEMTITTAYVGNFGTGLFMTDDPNFAGAYPQASRPDPRFGEQRVLTNLGFSRYHAWQTFARRRFSAGMTFTAAYTYSKYRDVTSSDTIFGQVPTVINTGASAAPGFQIGPTRPRPIDSEYGTSEFDAPHVLAISYLWELPVGRGRRALSQMPLVLDHIIGGWSVSGLINARSGNAFDVQLGQDVNDDGAFNDRPALASGATLSSLRDTGPADKTQWLQGQTAARNLLVVPSNVTDPFATIRRAAFRGPSLVNFDFSLAKNFRITERVRLGFESNFFNLFNRANFRPPVASLASPFFGQIQQTANNSTPRQIQFGLKLAF
jgi:hypothetical protein